MRLVRQAPDEPEAKLRVLAGQERTTGVLDQGAPEHAGPELRQASRIVRIEGRFQHSRDHQRTVDRPEEPQGASRSLRAYGPFRPDHKRRCRGSLPRTLENVPREPRGLGVLTTSPGPVPRGSRSITYTTLRSTSNTW